MDSHDTSLVQFAVPSVGRRDRLEGRTRGCRLRNGPGGSRWRYRLTVRTDGSQPSNRGSIPRTATRFPQLNSLGGYRDCPLLMLPLEHALDARAENLGNPVMSAGSGFAQRARGGIRDIFPAPNDRTSGGGHRLYGGPVICPTEPSKRRRGGAARRRRTGPTTRRRGVRCPCPVSDTAR